MIMPLLQHLGLAISLMLLAACSSGLVYQARPEFTPDGYTDTALDNRQYKIVYETYRKDAEEPLLLELALKRAGEIAAQNHSTIFDVTSKKFDFYQSRVHVPEQIIKHKIGGAPGNINSPGIPEQTYESIIPSHFKDFLVKRVTLVIEFPEQNKSNADTVNTIQSNNSEE